MANRIQPAASHGSTLREPVSGTAYIVFDRATGGVHHVHRVLTYGDSTPPEPRDINAKVLGLVRDRATFATDARTARTGSGATDHLDVVAVKLSEIDFARPHRVDLKTRRLVPLSDEG